MQWNWNTFFFRIVNVFLQTRIPACMLFLFIMWVTSLVYRLLLSSVLQINNFLLFFRYINVVNVLLEIICEINLNWWESWDKRNLNWKEIWDKRTRKFLHTVKLLHFSENIQTSFRFIGKLIKLCGACLFFYDNTNR